MKIRTFLIPLFFLFLISFAIAQNCFDIGQISGTNYCDIDGEYKALKSNGEACANGFECFNQSCIDGLCQSKFVNISLNLTLRTGLIGEILDMIQGIECDPRNQTYYCEGTEAFLCGINAVWEPKGEVPGECGVPFFTCGNGVIEPPYEECDDSNLINDDSCKNDCTINICGDNVIYSGVEQCDDGANGVIGDGCTDECVAETCTPGEVGNISCVGYYISLCNDSYMWVPINLTVGECGVECLPLNNETCEGTFTLLCNSTYVWENLGEVPGKCGVPLYTSGGGGGTRGIYIIMYSPINEVTYGGTLIPLKVGDKRNEAKFWKYSLNGGKKVNFIPNTTFFAQEGQNQLIVYARKFSSTSRESSLVTNFNVVLPEPFKLGYCGDGICSNEETCDTCIFDCSGCPIVEPEDNCGNGICDDEESSFICPEDCVALERKDYTPVAIGVAASSIAVLGFVLYRRFFVSSATKFLDSRSG